MPLSSTDPTLDYDGSWRDASVGWPSIQFPNVEAAMAAYVVAWRDVKVPYGSYVLVGSVLRLETEEQRSAVLAAIAAVRLSAAPVYDGRFLLLEWVGAWRNAGPDYGSQCRFATREGALAWAAAETTKNHMDGIEDRQYVVVELDLPPPPKS